ncbi:DMT family transporter [Nitrogeniibacter mangrovi]|uniref:DMT family transporter n=1 Tax=Nitrogeniibacter mangrovi TaxID=2016596 RepID=A0A6C1B8I2_9RHOO|nr:DMT family transporter [Nitrogeniibacter mangrovi]QID18650.1 DMT family transporter [Nitrogeniibacter mangrovi]
MRLRDLFDLVVLAAIWGASFMFTRVAAPEFGPVPLIFVRVLVAALALWPLVWARGLWPELKSHWRPIAAVGLLNAAIPFGLFAWALLSITGGVAAIGNATAPLWAALVGWVWLGERLDRWRTAGLVLGFLGVGILASDKAGVHGEHGLMAIGAILAATLMYGISANVVRRHLGGVSSLSVSLGSQVTAAGVLAPLAWAAWPQQLPGATAWGCAAALGVVCTALAFILYFRLIGHVGPARAVAVAYLIPAFGMAWGALFLDEPLTVRMLAGAAVVLAGTALTTGLVDGARVRRLALASARRSG